MRGNSPANFSPDSFTRPFYLPPFADFDFRLSIISHNTVTFRRPDDSTNSHLALNSSSREIARLPRRNLVCASTAQYKRHDRFRVLLLGALDEETEFCVTPLRTGGGLVAAAWGEEEEEEGRRRGGSRFADDDNGAGVSFANPRSGIRARARALTSFRAFRLAKRHPVRWRAYDFCEFRRFGFDRRSSLPWICPPGAKGGVYKRIY
jgi:hypothetical protein